MKLVTYKPNTFMDRFFDEDPFFRGMAPWQPSWDPTEKDYEGALKVNVVENENNYTLTAEVPGMTEKDIDVEIKDGRLTLKGHVEESKEKKEENFHMKEFHTRSFERSFTLGEGIDPENITAKLEHGILNIVLPKKEETKPKAVKVEIGS